MAFHPLFPASGFLLVFNFSRFLFLIIYFPFGLIEALKLLIEFPDESLSLSMPWTHTNSDAGKEISLTPHYTRPLKTAVACTT